jgi:hypothetical protein
VSFWLVLEFSRSRAYREAVSNRVSRFAIVVPTMDLIDSHAHVDVSDFDADREAMLERAVAAGVETLLAIGNGP